MFNRLQAIRAAVFGIVFDFLCLLVIILMHNYIWDYALAGICIALPILTLCVTWATLKPYVIYGGLHSMTWSVAAVLVIFMGFNPLPLVIGFFVTIFLFVKLDQIMLFLYNLQRPRILFERARPKQPRYEPGTPLDTSTYYQGGYQPQKSAQDSEQTLFYPQSSDGLDRVQLHYPEM